MTSSLFRCIFLPTLASGAGCTGSPASKDGASSSVTDTAEATEDTSEDYTDLRGDSTAPDTASSDDESRYAPLRINEFMALNSAAYTPDDGLSHPDWIELFNTGAETIDLSGLLLTDDLDEPAKATLPEGLSLEPGAFLLLHATGTEAPTGTELPFKLSSEGEAIGMSTPSGQPIHLLTFDAQQEDCSAALAIDGDRDSGWVYTVGGTPGRSNHGE